MSSTNAADRGLALLGAAVATGKLNHDELLEVINYVISAHCEEPGEARAVHAGRLFADALVQSRGTGRVSKYSREPVGTVAPVVRATAASILAAHKKALGEAVVELPANPVARAVILADMKRRGETPPGGRKL